MVCINNEGKFDSYIGYQFNINVLLVIVIFFFTTKMFKDDFMVLYNQSN